MKRWQDDQSGLPEPMAFWRAGLAAGGLAGLLAGLVGFLVWVFIAYLVDVLSNRGLTWREVLISFPVVVVSLGLLGIPVMLLLGGLVGIVGGTLFGAFDGQANGRTSQRFSPLLWRLLGGVFGGVVGGFLWNAIFVSTPGGLNLVNASLGVAVGLLGGFVAGPTFARRYRKRIRIGRD